MSDNVLPIPPAQSPINLIFPVRSAEASARLLRLIPTLQSSFRAAMAEIPQVHFFRCLLLNGGNELAIIVTSDGSLDDFLDAFVAKAGTLIDQFLEEVASSAPIPVSLRKSEFKQFAKIHNVPSQFWYMATPSLTANVVREKATLLGISPGDSVTKPSQNTLCAVLNVASPEHAQALRTLITKTGDTVLGAFKSIGTVHFARFVFFRNETQFAIITVFDGTFDAYSHDFVFKIGEVFDALLPHVVGGDSSLIPVKEHFQTFHQIIVDSNYAPPLLWYSAYPSLTVQNKLAFS